ncbi:MAG: pyruvate kinase [Armatimonadetes bacterium]|nr:pyruvate kinase [Armatimonadota bacterium]
MKIAARHLFNRTKIVCTVGPACEDFAVLERMLEAGMDVVRLNFSHADHDWHARMIEKVRALERKTGTFIGIIADLQGPRFRVGALKGGRMTLHEGTSVRLTTRPVVGDGGLIPTDYAGLPRDVKPGDRILLDDGLLELRVVSVAADEVVCDVVVGGELLEHKGMNLPGVKVSARSLTDKDREDLRFALEHEVDYVALSFVRSAADVGELKELIRELGGRTHVIAKLEKPEALEELDRVVQSADAVMVARGDLGVELRPEEVPFAQKKIINACMAHRKPVITATQMLDSMREHPRPTRAEVTDVANAILDGTDAVMLSGETAAGKYPVEAVAMMARIAYETERYQIGLPHLTTDVAADTDRLLVADAVARSAAEAAENLGARLIVAFTQSGWTARLISKCRPAIPIVAATPDVQTARRCSLYWGVTPLLIVPAESTDDMIAAVEDMCLAHELAGRGDTLVITAGTPMGRPGTTNMMRVEKIGGAP